MAETHIARMVREATGKNTRDKESKNILKCKEVLAHILKHAVPEFHDFSYDEIANRFIEPESISQHEPVLATSEKGSIEGILAEDSPPGEATVEFDVLFKAKMPDALADEKHSVIYINVEGQGFISPGYPLPKRATYYSARLLSRQLDSLSDPTVYNMLQKVYSIWICFADNVAARKQGSVVNVKLAPTFSGTGKVEFDERDIDLMQMIYIVLDKNDLESDLVGFLGVLFNPGLSDDERLARLQTDHGLTVTNEVESEVRGMTGIYEYHRQEGLREGRLEGNQETTEAFVIKLIDKGLTVKEIVELTDISEDDVRDIAKKHNRTVKES